MTPFVLVVENEQSIKLCNLGTILRETDPTVNATAPAAEVLGKNETSGCGCKHEMGVGGSRSGSGGGGGDGGVGGGAIRCGVRAAQGSAVRSNPRET